jgi:hypothetical protein
MQIKKGWDEAHRKEVVMRAESDQKEQELRAELSRLQGIIQANNFAL